MGDLFVSALKTMGCSENNFDSAGARHYDTAPMSRDSALDIEALATRGAEVDAEFALRDLPRIAPSLLRPEGTARVHLRFHHEQIGEGRYPVAEGRVAAMLALP